MKISKKFVNKEHLNMFKFKMVVATIISIIFGLIICIIFNLYPYIFFIFTGVCSSICFYFIGLGSGFYEANQKWTKK